MEQQNELFKEVLACADRLHKDVHPFVVSARNSNSNLSDAHNNIGRAINRGDAEGVIAHCGWYLQAIRETKLYHECPAVKDAADCLKSCVERATAK